MRKNLLWISLFISLIVCASCVNMNGVSAVEYPAIVVIPETTVNPTLKPGMNYKVSIYTNYTGNDVWGWQLSLSYNPNVLHGGINNTDTWTGDGVNTIFYTTKKPVVPDSEKVYVNGILMTRDVDYIMNYKIGGIKFTTAPGQGAGVKAMYLYHGVVNGDLITTVKNPNAMFDTGLGFNNTSGKLEVTTAWFYWSQRPVPTTYGPGILANVTFTVVGYGTSNITLGTETRLVGWTQGGMGDMYYIIDADVDPDHIQHGFFSNMIPGDLDGDRYVGPIDLNMFAAAYGKRKGQTGYRLLADLDRDGYIGPIDLNIFAANYGKRA